MTPQVEHGVYRRAGQPAVPVHSSVPAPGPSAGCDSVCLSSPHARSRPTSKADFYTIIQCLMVPSLSSSQPWDACSQLNVQSISQYSAVRSVIGSKSSVLCASPYKHIYDILYVDSPTQLLQLCLSPSLNNKQLTDLATQLNQ